MMDVTLLGTAALAPIPTRSLASAAMTASGHTVLFDCGEGTQVALRREHVSPMKIDVIALTHYHGDHTFGLPGLLQTMNVAKRTSPLLLTGPEGLAEALSPLLAAAGRMPYDIYLSEPGPEGLRLDKVFAGFPDGTLLRAFPTRHGVPSVAYRLELPRAGKFLPERALALGVPQKLWGVLQSGETVVLDDGREIAPSDVLGEPRRGITAA